MLTALTLPHLDYARELEIRQNLTNTTRRLPPIAFENEAVLLALEHKNAQNPVLRAAAGSIIEDTAQ